MSDAHRPDAQQLDAWMNGFREAQLLLTAHRLALFDAIGGEALPADTVAARLKTDPRATRILLRALTAMGLLQQQDDGSYANSDLARRHLLADSPDSRQGILHHNARLYHTWGDLYEVVRSGRPAREEVVPPELAHDPAAFAQAMANVAQGVAEETAAAMQLRDPACLLDAGGGPGRYAAALAERYPTAQVVLMDSAPTLAVADEHIRQQGLEERIETRVGDLLSDPLGDAYDGILVSNVIHMLSPEANARLVARAAEALAPGGTLFIKDFVLDPNRTEPASAAIFAINMLVNTEAGDCYTVGDMQAWFAAAGLKLVDVTPVATRSRLVAARRE